MLYFFREQAAVVTHGFTKRGKKVPVKEIKRAKDFRDRYESDPERHTNEEG